MKPWKKMCGGSGLRGVQKSPNKALQGTGFALRARPAPERER